MYMLLQEKSKDDCFYQDDGDVELLSYYRET